MPFCEVVWNTSVLFYEHHGIACQLEPASESILRLSLILVYHQVTQSVDCTKLINVTTSGPEHLIDAVLLRSCQSFIESLFELSGRQ